MTDHPTVRWTGAIIALTLATWALLADPGVTRQALETAIALWWNHLVPVLLPGYVFAQAFQALVPRRPVWILLALSWLTFPPVAAIVLYDWVKTHDHSRRNVLPLLLYTNLYNPLLFPHPGMILRLDAALIGAALVLTPPWHLPRIILPPMALRPRQWILDGMNWTTILGLVVTVAWLLHRLLPQTGVGWLLDPILIHWGQTPKASWGTNFWTGLGGIIWWIPIIWRTSDNRRTGWTVFAARLMQALLASLILLALPS